MSSGDQRWLEPLWLASGNPRCSVILSFQVLGFISSEQTRQKSNPETQITGKQGSWPVWDSHGSPGTCKGFLCAVWIQFLGQLPFSRDISKGQQEAGHELCWPAEAPSSPSIPQERGWKPGWAAWWNVSRRNARKSPRAMTEALNLISVTYIGTASSPSRETQSTWGRAEGAAGPGVQERGRL